MSKFVTVKEEPKELAKGTYVIKFPDFLAEVEANSRRAPRTGMTAINHLRFIVWTIAEKYDPTNVFNVTNALRPHLFEGRAYKDNKELSAIVVEMLTQQCPGIFERYLDYQVKNRPANTRLVYYVGPFISTAPFFTNGLDSIDEKDVENYLSGKPKKVVGKPAITDEEAQA